MKTYKVTYRETLVHHVFVDAENEEEAMAKFEQGVMKCDIVLRDGEVEDTDLEIEEVPV